nr:hypothetical protein [Tanacetum cinerariifolium]
MLLSSLILTLHPLIPLQVIDLDRIMPYTSHLPMGFLGIASVASFVSDVSVKKAFGKSGKIGDSGRMVTSVSILKEPIKVANALSRTQVQDDVVDDAKDEDAANDISAEPTPPSPTPANTPPH